MPWLPDDMYKTVFQMFPPCCSLFIHSFLLLATVDCQQAEQVGEMEAGGKGSPSLGEIEAGGKGSSKSSLAEFVDNLIDQMNDAKVGMS